MLRNLLSLSTGDIRRLEDAGVVSGWPPRPGASPPDQWGGTAILGVDGARGHPLGPLPPSGPVPRGRRGPSEGDSPRAGPNVGPESASGDAVAWSDWIRQRTSPDHAGARPEALDDLVVLDASVGHVGSLFCSSILAEFGATVIRIEPPGGDPARRFSPLGITCGGTGLGYLVEGRNKLHVTLNLETGEGRAIWRALTRQADVVIENFPAGTLDRQGVGYRHLAAENPRLIYVALSTYGQFGPRARTCRPDYDITDQALSGLVHVCGEREEDEAGPHAVPTRAGQWLAWYAQGGWGAFGVLAALRHRGTTGQGQMVDVAGAEALVRFVDFNLLLYHTSGRVRGRVGPFDESNNPYTYLPCKNGYVFLAGFSDTNFYALAEVIGRPDLRDDPRFDSAVKRSQPEHWWPLYREIEKWTRRLTADEILERVMGYQGRGVVVTGKINGPAETLDEAHWWERGVFRRLEDPVYGELLVQAPPWKMTETPPRLKWLCRPVGADNEYVYLKHLGYGCGRIRQLRESGIL